MQVDQLARAAGVTPRLVRHWARSGLLDETRAPNGYRHWRTRSAHNATQRHLRERRRLMTKRSMMTKC